ncbi:MAG: hypothetical protein U0805_04915 [Pirellulales bacterium]
MESLDQLKAILAFNLRHAVRSNVPDWIVEGASQLYLVPEVRKQMEAAADHRAFAFEAVYAAREHCDVRREWLKLAIKELSEVLKSLQPTALVTFAFEGSTLSIDGGRRIIVQAEGAAWKQTHAVRAADLTTLPKRLMHDQIEVAAYNGRLKIGNHSYPVAEAAAPAHQRGEDAAN